MEPISNLKKVKLFIHGACPSGKMGLVGWACELLCDGVTAEMFGSDPESSDNRMALRGATEGFSALKQRCMVTAYTNSEYLYKGMTNWLPKWKTNGWQTETGPVKNQFLWKELGDAAPHHVVRWRLITSENPDFADLQLCENLAVEAARQQISSSLTRKPPERAAPQEGDAAPGAAEQVPA